VSATAKRVLIVDDEPAARAQLREVISGVDNLTVIAEVSDGNAAIAAITEHTPDIVFLDIDMPGVDGFGVASATEHLMYQLVFVTAHHQYALKAFDTHAIDYLLKPARPAVIEKCLAKMLRQEVLTLEVKTEPPAGSTLVLTDSGTSRYVSKQHILYIEAMGRYRRIHLSEEGVTAHKLPTLLSDTTLDDFTLQLGESDFFRVHRGYLVSLAHVTSLKSQGRRLGVCLNGAEAPLPVSRSRAGDLKSAIDRFLRQD